MSEVFDRLVSTILVEHVQLRRTGGARPED